MKLTILKNDFLQALNLVQGVVEKKNVMPILANILLEAEGPLLKISATDLEVAINIKAQAQVERPGKVTVLAKKLYDIVKEAPAEEITIDSESDDRVEIVSKQSQCKILSLPANEFPKLPDLEGDFIKVKSNDFLSMLEKVSFAMSTDETRYHLNGVYLEKNDKGLNIVATDGHRLSLTKRDLDIPDLTDGGIIIPRKGVNELKKVIASENGFELALGKRYLFVSTEKLNLFIRLIDGDFPQYQRVIPDESPIEIQIPREEFIGALRRVSLLSDEYSKGVKLYFCRDSLLVNTTNHEIGEAKEEVLIDYKGETLDVSFNSKYLLDVLNAIPDEMVKMRFIDNTSPCVINCESDAGFCSVIMPMRS